MFTVDLSPERARDLAEMLQRLVERGLAHAHIAAPIAAGTEDGVAYLASEYVAAEGTDTALRQYGPAPIPEALRLVRRLAGAVDFAATVGVHHGCLHPRDILVAPEEARITGFGVAEALEQVGLRAPVRRPYSSPERIEGGSVDRFTDVYALAALSFELLLGRRLAGPGDEGLAGLEDLRDADVSGLRETFACALDPNPDLRFRTAQSFTDALQSHFGRADTARVVDFARPVESDRDESADEGEPASTGEAPNVETDAGAPPSSRAFDAPVDTLPAVFEPPVNLLPARTTSGVEEDRDQDDRLRWDDEAPSATPIPAELSTRVHTSGFGMGDWESTRPAKVDAPTPSFTPGLAEWAAHREEPAPKREPASSGSSPRSSDQEFGFGESVPSPVSSAEKDEHPSAAWDADFRSESQPAKPWDAPYAPGQTTEERFAALAQDRPVDVSAATSSEIVLPDPGPSIPDSRSSRDSADFVDDLRPSGYLSTDTLVPRAFAESLPARTGGRSRGHWKIVAVLVSGLAVGLFLGFQLERRWLSGPVTNPPASSATKRPVAGPGRSAPARGGQSQAPPTTVDAGPARGGQAPSSTPTPASPPATATTKTGREFTEGTIADGAARRATATPPAPSAPKLVPAATPDSKTASAPAVATTPVPPSGRAAEAGFKAPPIPSPSRASGARSSPKAPARAAAPPAVATTDRGSVLVDSRPRGARVLVDGQPAGTTPLSIAQVPAGAHSVRLDLAGYRPWIASVGVVEGQQTRVAASLEPETEK